MDEARRVESDYEQATPDGGFGDQSDSGESVPSNVTNIMDRAKRQIEPTVEKAKGQIDGGVGKAAAGLESTAERIKGMTGEGEGMPAHAGVKVADTMETAAAYLKEHSSDEIFKDLSSYVKQHPVKALIGAIFAGFLVGRVMH